MPTSTSRKRKSSLAPYLNFLIPAAFLFGLLSGYLLWGSSGTPVAAEPTQVKRVSVSTDGDPSLGPADAPITIVEFSDYQCPYCISWYQEVFNKLMENYPGKIRFVYRDLPLPMHLEAVPAAEAANCAGELGSYWQFHNAFLSGKITLGRTAYEKLAADLSLDPVKFAACLDDHRYLAEVQEDAAEANRLGLSGTPSFVINGRILVGAMPFEDFKAIIDEELLATQ